MGVGDSRALFLEALAEQDDEWEDEDWVFAPTSPLLTLHGRASSDDLATLWVEFAGGTEDERILLARVCGEAHATLPDVVRDGLLAWLGEPAEPPLLTWVVGQLSQRPELDEATLSATLRLLDHPDTEVRYSLTGLLSLAGEDPAAVEGLLELSEDADGDVRFGAIFELQELATEAEHVDERVQEVLRDATDDTDRRIRSVVTSG